MIRRANLRLAKEQGGSDNNMSCVSLCVCAQVCVYARARVFSIKVVAKICG